MASKFTELIDDDLDVSSPHFNVTLEDILAEEKGLSRRSSSDGSNSGSEDGLKSRRTKPLSVFIGEKDTPSPLKST
ncbi:hypothetical protein MMC09_004731, partial [Bachmanniomyces sp. S44760]|nr:hypothetical protein [Bachmanniomyces sp. S44760]